MLAHVLGFDGILIPAIVVLAFVVYFARQEGARAKTASGHREVCAFCDAWIPRGDVRCRRCGFRRREGRKELPR
jgi:ribosomal protein L40E